MKFFTVPVFDAEAAEREVNRFLAQHRVLSVGTSTKRSRIDYREILSDEDFAIYANLRDLRKGFADDAGIPAYAVFTNDQLAAMVRGRVRTKAGLAKIEKVGDAKVKKYGDVFVERLTELHSPKALTNGPTNGDARAPS